MKRLRPIALSTWAVLAASCNLTGTRDLDFRASTAGLADVLGQITPRPQWALPIVDHGLEQIVCWQDEIMVALAHQTRVATSNRTGLINSRLIAVDAVAGRQLWDATLDGTTEAVASIRATTAGLLVVFHEPGGSRFSMHDWRTGRVGWERSVDGVLDVVLEDGTAVVSAAGAVFAWSLADDQELWRVPVAARRLVPTSSGLLAIGQDLVLVNPSTGVLRWRLDPPAWLSKPLVIEGAPGLLLQDGPRLMLITAGGAPAWEREFAVAPTFVRLTSEELLVALRSSAGGDDLVCLDPARGTDRWRTPLEDVAQSVPVVVDRHIVVTTPQSVRTLDRATGDQVWCCPLAGSSAASRFPDQIIVRSDHLVVVAEHVVTSLRVCDGTVRWAIAAPSPKHAEAERQEAIYLATAMSFAKRLAKTPDMLGILRSVGESASPPELANRLQAHRDMLIRLGEARGAAMREERAHARRLRQETGVGNPVIDKLMARVELQSQVWGFIFARFEEREMVNAYGCIHQALLFAARRRHIVEAMLNCQFGRFIARPFAWADGSGILLIDIDDGAWREFVTKPDEGVATKNLVGLEPFTVLPGDRILTCGVELDSKRWQTLPLQDPFTRRANRTMNRSILALAIERRDFAPASDYPARALALRGGAARSW